MKDDVFALLSSKSPNQSPIQCLTVTTQNESFNPNLKTDSDSTECSTHSFDDLELKIKLLEEQAKHLKVNDEENLIKAYKPLDTFKAIVVTPTRTNNGIIKDYGLLRSASFANKNEDIEMKKIK